MIPRSSGLVAAALGASLLLATRAAPQVGTPVDVPVDASVDPKVGETITISSRSQGLPVVEPHVSAHPTDPDHLLVAAMVVTDVSRPYESCRLSSFLSTDGGASWKETEHDWWGYDPWTAIQEDGRAVMSWLGTPGRFRGQFPVRLFFSEDGGASWSEEVQTLEGAHDGTKLTARADAVAFTAVRFRHDVGGADVVLYRREGKGRFEAAACIEGKGQRLNFCEPAILSDDTILVPASHFQREVWVQAWDPGTAELSERDVITARGGGGRGYLHLVADTGEESPHRDRLYFVRALASSSGAPGVWLNASEDRGLTWTEDLRVDRFESARPSRALVPSIAVNRRGLVGVSWVDSQQHEDPNRRDLYFALSRDGGESFERPVRVTRSSTDPRSEANGAVADRFPGGGHYLGITARADGSFQLVWSDSRSGVFELQTCRIEVSATDEAEGSGSQGPG